MGSPNEFFGSQMGSLTMGIMGDTLWGLGNEAARAAGAYDKGNNKNALQKKMDVSAERERRRQVAIAAQSNGRRSTLLSGAGGPQPAASRVTLLGGA